MQFMVMIIGQWPTWEAICWTVGVKPISLRINCTSSCLDPLLLRGGHHSHHQWLCCYFMPSAWGPGGQVLFVGKSVFLYSRLAVQLTSFIGKANLWIIDMWLYAFLTCHYGGKLTIKILGNFDFEYPMMGPARCKYATHQQSTMCHTF